MNEKIINRLFTYLESKSIPHTRFEKEIGLSNGYLKTQEKRSADLGESIIKKIIDYCLDLNSGWLLTGKGNMINKNPYNQESTPYIVNEEPMKYNIQSDIYYNMYKEKDKEVSELREELGKLKEQVNQLNNIINKKP